MPNINAALGVAQLENLDLYIQKKRKLAETYESFFSSVNNITFFAEPEHSVSNYWLNVIIFETVDQRDLFLKESNSQKVMTRPVWRLMSKLPMFEKHQKDSLANSNWFESRVVNIPSSVCI